MVHGGTIESQILRNYYMARLLAVLLADDDQHRVALMQRAFEAAKISNPLIAVPNGKSAISYLRAQGRYRNRKIYPEPCLVLADLSPPVSGGLEILEWARYQSPSRPPPIIVLTHLEGQEDVRKASVLGADGYLIKPRSYDALVTIAKELKQEWLQPRKERALAGRKATKTSAQSGATES